MKHSLKRAILLIGSLIITFAVLRVSLIISPNSNFDVGPYNSQDSSSHLLRTMMVFRKFLSALI